MGLGSHPRSSCQHGSVGTYIRLPCTCGSRDYVERAEGRVKRQPFCAACGARLQTASQLTFRQRVIIALIVTAVVIVAAALLIAFAPIWWTIGIGIAVVLIVGVFVATQVM